MFTRLARDGFASTHISLITRIVKWAIAAVVMAVVMGAGIRAGAYVSYPPSVVVAAVMERW